MSSLRWYLRQWETWALLCCYLVIVVAPWGPVVANGRLNSDPEQWSIPGTIAIAGFESVETSIKELHWDAAEIWYSRCYRLAVARQNRPLACKALNNIGAIRLQFGELKEAEALFLEVLRLSPGDLDAATNLASVYLYRAREGAPEKRSKAIALYKVILAQRPNFAQAWCNLGVAWADSGDLDAARECYAEALRLDPNNRLYQENMERE